MTPLGMTNDVATHYGTEGLLGRILEALTQAGKDVTIRLTIDDLGPVDEFHSRRRRATRGAGTDAGTLGLRRIA